MNETAKGLGHERAYLKLVNDAGKDLYSKTEVAEMPEINQTLINPQAPARLSTFIKSYRGIATTPISRDIVVAVFPEDQEVAGQSTVTTQRNAIFRDVSLIIDLKSGKRELDLIYTGAAVVVEEHNLGKVDLENDPHNFQNLIKLYQAAGLAHHLPHILHILRPLKQDQ